MYPKYLFVVLAGLGFCVGCGASLPATVSGKIMVDGNELPSGEYVFGDVMFYPTAGGAAAIGDVKGGTYSVTSLDKVLFGDVVNTVVRESQVPVLVVRHSMGSCPPTCTKTSRAVLSGTRTKAIMV